VSYQTPPGWYPDQNGVTRFGKSGAFKVAVILASVIGMGLTALVAFVVVASFNDGPGDVAKDYYTAYYDGDAKAMCELVSDADKKAMERLANSPEDCELFANAARGIGSFLAARCEVSGIEVASVDERDDTAHVELRVEANPGCTPLVRSDHVSVDLVKEHGDWKVTLGGVASVAGLLGGQPDLAPWLGGAE